ncbi:metal-sensitive transcriptional regulator [Sanguibacter sp. HDW7]|uniref:metal-sensitive transcriptional regulator n=1 Tax=Sanguibacter sp. HDW7 TaxID=2714931 RepID=UPI0014095383|nr:metal-sensitive transcriptional regulator [Sanguibacter sp. HDW7]QIK83037.1 metal-sensitive transcriptional regulator [Sanguibacter sp. HDW7]
MQLPEETTQSAVRRLKRAQGQLGGIIRMLEEGRDCEDVMVQVAAAAKAIDRAGFAIIAGGMRECLVADDGTEGTERLEKLFLSLA